MSLAVTIGTLGSGSIGFVLGWTLYFANRGNSFHGSLPTELGELSLLQELDVSGNRFIYGTVPSELALIPDLSRLSIIGTSITGTIPEGLCSKVNRGDLVLIANESIARTCQWSL